MNTSAAAFALILSLAVLSASGCGTPIHPMAAKYTPGSSCLSVTGAEYDRCANREMEKLENTAKHRAAAEAHMNQTKPVPRSCVPNGFGGFDCR